MINNLWTLTQKIIYKSYFSSFSKDLKHILSLYNGSDWRNFIDSSENKMIYGDMNYSKTLLPYKIDHRKMYLLAWDHDGETKIHGHGEDGCIFKVLEGNLLEETYKSDNLKYLKNYKHSEGSIKYIDNNISFHKILNNNKDGVSYSLHIY